MTLSQFVGAGAARAGCSDAALVWLDRVDGTWLDRAAAAAHAQVTAVCCISLGQRARARQVIARVTRPAPSPLWERALVAIEVLLDALEGDAERAEVRAREGLAQETEATVRATWQTAHAHALAALGHRDDALAALRAVRDAFPSDPMLARIARHGGPASALAESLLTEARTPYR